MLAEVKKCELLMHTLQNLQKKVLLASPWRIIYELITVYNSIECHWKDCTFYGLIESGFYMERSKINIISLFILYIEYGNTENV